MNKGSVRHKVMIDKIIRNKVRSREHRALLLSIEFICIKDR